jgi:hypothetical protein
MNVGREVSLLVRMSAKQLRQKYLEVFGEENNSRNKAWLVKRITWRMQAKAEGGLSERAIKRAAEIADEADLRIRPPSMKAPVKEAPVAVLDFKHVDDRLPPPGTVITRKYKGEVLQVRVRSDGFEYDGQVYASLSAVAKVVTGTHCNGYAFFHLAKRGDA